ncbi:hypothetical protein V1512DRAFT_260748 [Lipomyces arxii]|uniref:uncharacterized protein n=1 Tax=Lipomyces arxii TaxID=56418 RepID=UPI0034CF8900
MYHQPPTISMSPAAKRMRVDMPPYTAASQQLAQTAVGFPPHHMPQQSGQSQASPRLQHQIQPGQPGQSAQQNLPASVYAAHHSLIMSLDDEDMVGAADDLDTVSAREVSASRYAHHHEWMEQILGSAYQSDKIIPPGLFAAKSGNGAISNTTAETVWGTLEQLRERVQEMEEEVSGVDELYTRNMVDIKEGKISALKRGERRLARLIQRDQEDSGVGGIRLVEGVDEMMERILKDVENSTDVAIGRNDDGTGVVKTKWPASPESS